MLKNIGLRFTKAGCAAVLLCLCGSNAFADLAFNIQGSTTGQFIKNGQNKGTSVDGIEFDNASFGPTKNTQIVLGTFSLDTFIRDYSGANYDFTLGVNLTAPTTGGTTFTADITGSVFWGYGSATVNFANNGPKHFAFSNAQGTGSFDLYVTDVVVNNGGTGTLYGNITNAQFAATPEPAAIVLTSALFGGVLIVFRKRMSCS